MIRFGLTFLLIVAGAGFVRAEAPRPVSVRLDVRWGPGGGTESVRQAVERAALRSADDRACVEAIFTDSDSAAEFLWNVVLVDLDEETVYDSSVYGVQVPGEPGKDLARTARIQLDLTSQVLHTESGAADKVRPVRVAESRRPRVEGEDTASQIRADVIRRLERELGRVLCRGVKRLDRARTSP